jgi:signal transduction histidine kinase
MKNDEISDDEIINLVTKRIREREKKVKELEFMFAEMEEMNKKLLHSDESKSHFISLIRNEFKNPLFGIIPVIENMLLKNEDDPNAADQENEEVRLIYNELQNIFYLKGFLEKIIYTKLKAFFNIFLVIIPRNDDDIVVFIFKRC